jgi:hypothetical protein
MTRGLFWCALCVALVIAFAGTAFAQAQDDKEQIARGQADVEQARVDAAVKKACAWLKTQQQADGHWAGKAQHLDNPYPEGVTGLALYALLKGGIDKEEECIKKGFNYLRPKKFTKVYNVSTLILALTALYQPPPPEKEFEEEEKKGADKMRTSVFEPYEKKLKKNFKKKVPKWAMDWLKRAVQWLVSQQQANIWRSILQCVLASQCPRMFSPRPPTTSWHVRKKTAPKLRAFPCLPLTSTLPSSSSSKKRCSRR